LLIEFFVHSKYIFLHILVFYASEVLRTNAVPFEMICHYSVVNNSGRITSYENVENITFSIDTFTTNPHTVHDLHIHR